MVAKHHDNNTTILHIVKTYAQKINVTSDYVENENVNHTSEANFEGYVMKST